jgi:hypothetical protein
MSRCPELEIMTQSFKVPMFPLVAFSYLAFKLVDKSIQLTVNQKQ